MMDMLLIACFICLSILFALPYNYYCVGATCPSHGNFHCRLAFAHIEFKCTPLTRSSVQFFDGNDLITVEIDN